MAAVHAMRNACNPDDEMNEHSRYLLCALAFSIEMNNVDSNFIEWYATELFSIYA